MPIKGDRVYAFYGIQANKRVYSPAKVKRVHTEPSGAKLYRVKFYKNNTKKHVNEVIEMDKNLLVNKRYKDKRVPDILLPVMDDSD